MRVSFKNQIALPPDISFDIIETPDASVNQAAVDHFVDHMQRPKWYEDKGQLRASRDTRIWMLSNRQFKAVQDPFTGRQMRIFLCERCQNGVSESGVDLGHKIQWRTYLKQAGVEAASEARAMYNNLNNLILECRSCNVSHDWENQ